MGKRVLNILSAYAPHSGRPRQEKEDFWSAMFEELVKIKAEESVFVGEDMNGHVGSNADGCEGVHEGHGYGVRNEEGEMLLEFAVALDMVVSNTFFKKQDSRTITYESGGCKSAIDFDLGRKAERSAIRDIKVINGEACIMQHKLVIGIVRLDERVQHKKIKAILKAMI